MLCRHQFGSNTCESTIGAKRIKCKCVRVTLSKKGYSVRKIAEKVGVPKSCVRYSIKKYGATRICSSGRPRKTIETKDRHIITEAKEIGGRQFLK